MTTLENPDAIAVARAVLPGVEDAVLGALAAELDEPLDERTIRNARTGVRTAVEALAEGRKADDGLFIAHGRAQCRAGRSMEEMLAIYRLAGLVVHRRAAELGVARGLPAEQFALLAESIFEGVHELSAAAADGYAEARAATAEARHLRRTRLFRLLTGDRSPAPQEIERRARAAQWPLPTQVVPLALPQAAGEALEDGFDSSVLVGHVADVMGLLVSAADAGWVLDRLRSRLPDRTPVARACRPRSPTRRSRCGAPLRSCGSSARRCRPTACTPPQTTTSCCSSRATRRWQCRSPRGSRPSTGSAPSPARG